jgi:Xaa-Pro dipeptidase
VERPRLRAGRLQRLQRAMGHHGVDACLLFNEPNIRYATGTSVMPVYSMSTFVRCALVPRAGRPILFEHPNSIHRSRASTDADVRPMRAWEFTDAAEEIARDHAREVAAAMGELGIGAREIAVDRLGTPGYLALQREGFVIRDAAPVAMAAREVKTAEEIALFRANGTLILDMLGAFERAIAPGIRERDLLATLADRMHRGGGEYLATTTVCSGPNTNPWRSEATSRVLEPGDLVYVDTDTVGIGGYFFCVSRTFLCGDTRPTREQRDAYSAAHDWLQGMIQLVRPGMTCGELARKAPTVPERYLPQRYECMIHGVGFEEESPSVCYPQDPQVNPDRVLQEGMTLVVEIYAGEPGRRDGVKLGDEVLVTPGGVEILAPYPYARRLLG